jgi:uncharacterized protein
MKEIRSLALYVTDDCNFKCDYCYQNKGKVYTDVSTIKKAIDFFYPFLSKRCTINFYGGEPLLNKSLIHHGTDILQTINKADARHIVYSMSTNGSLIDAKMLAFMGKYRFSLLISFDGISQDITRKKESFNRLIATLQNTLHHPRIELETNSVFTPSTIGCLSDSLQLIAEIGVPHMSFALSQTSDWGHSSLACYLEQLEHMKNFLIRFYSHKGFIPLVNFRLDSSKGLFRCYAGKDRMAISADGKVWGCHLFADYYNSKESSEGHAKFCFGDLDSFSKYHEEIYPKIAANYDNLRMDQFHTSHLRCADCPELRECRVCPMDNMIQSRNFREIPDWVCEQKRMTRKIKKEFWEQLGDPLPADHPVNHG